nr:hypothetical protein GCM10011355_12780 [Aquisalinus luteolus]
MNKNNFHLAGVLTPEQDAAIRAAMTMPGRFTFTHRDHSSTFEVNAAGDRMDIFSACETQLVPASEPVVTPEKPKFDEAQLEQLVQARQWDEAVQMVALSGGPAHARYVLLMFIRTATSRDARYEAGRMAIYENIELFPLAATASGPLERQELSRYESLLRTQIDGPVYSGTSYRMNAATVGDCRSQGGTVRSGGCWSN